MYKKMIAEYLSQTGRTGYDPRHIEAFMRLGHQTLDGLSRKQFEREIEIGIACIDHGGKQEAERCAWSFGL